MVSAHRLQLPIADFTRENTLRLAIGDESLFPDCSFCVPVSALTNVRRFDLYYTSVSDLTPLKGLTKMTTLHLYGATLKPLLGGRWVIVRVLCMMIESGARSTSLAD